MGELREGCRSIIPVKKRGTPRNAASSYRVPHASLRFHDTDCKFRRASESCWRERQIAWAGHGGRPRPVSRRSLVADWHHTCTCPACTDVEAWQKWQDGVFTRV